jgi:hypothetical protein
MSKRVVYLGTFPDGSQLMIERFLDDDGNEVQVSAATRPTADRGVVWGPPTLLARDPVDW